GRDDFSTMILVTQLKETINRLVYPDDIQKSLNELRGNYDEIVNAYILDEKQRQKTLLENKSVDPNDLYTSSQFGHLELISRDILHGSIGQTASVVAQSGKGMDLYLISNFFVIHNKTFTVALRATSADSEQILAVKSLSSSIIRWIEQENC